MGKTYKAVVALAIIVVLGYGGWRIYKAHQGKKAGLLSEKIVHNGDLWISDYEAQIPAPEPKVFEAIRDIEKSHSPGVQSVKVISQTDDTKTVEMDFTGFGGQPLAMQLVFAYDPAAKKISYHTIDNSMFQSNAVYQLSPDYGSTILTYHGTTRMLQSLPIPDAMIKEAIRSIFIAQLEGLKNALHISQNAQSDEDSDEP